MCSVGDDFETESKESPKFMLKRGPVQFDKCNKCKDQKPVILLRYEDAYCKDCFLMGSNHKFKALLGKSKLIRPNDRVLISYEVGQPSSALLHLLRNGLDLDSPKRLRIEPVIVFLEDQYHLTVKERQDMIDKVVNDILTMKFKPHLISFACSLLNEEMVISDRNLTISEDDWETVDKIFAKQITNSNKHEALNIFRRDVLIAVAKKLQCKFIFTPELSVEIASSLLTNMSLGRGSQVPDDTGFCDSRDKDVKILRPLRTFDMKEIAFYNILHGLAPVSIKQPVVNPYSSIQTLMKQFITGLQRDYPATVATVVRTGDKLALDKTKVSGKCKLCQGVVLRKTEELTSEESISFSKIVSNELPDHKISSEERYVKVKEKFDNNYGDEKSDEYCFSCSKLYGCLL
ncbi:cytoplasmic tRNA 2-thiolation protein 2-A-like [Euwallacea similis]|uniref:cytoplasmic tRNA 2-thiolation protein 2-A-like n=1 Tax=Euwallacea similis TaxID=1736056 RepID=UPI00344BC8C3